MKPDTIESKKRYFFAQMDKVQKHKDIYKFKRVRKVKTSLHENRRSNNKNKILLK